MIGQPPLDIAQLLIRCIPGLRTTSNNETTAMAPVLHTHTSTSLALGNQQDPYFILEHLQTRLPRLPGPGPPVLAWCVAVRVCTGGPRRGDSRWAAHRGSVLSPWVDFLG